MDRVKSAGRSLVATAKARPEFFLLLAASAVLYLWSITRNGWANEYYAAAARSMGSDWHDFLFNSFDPAGIQTLDKSPLSSWAQALSVRIFGFSSLSILAPQALMSVATVGLTYSVVFRRFGRWAALFAGAGVAVTPMIVAVARSNNPDALLTLTSVAAVWALLRAIDGGGIRWIVWAGVFVGLGFETKMAAGLLVLPALALAFIWMAPGGLLPTLKKIGAGAAALIVTALAWPVLVWLTPAAHRPWIAGTDDNSIWSLITGYNGLGRVTGGEESGNAIGGGFGGSGGGLATAFGNDPGTFRMFGMGFGGQAAWLLAFAALVAVALVVSSRLRRSDQRTGFVIAVGGSLATMVVTFSYAKGIFHPYYIAQFAPFAAMLFGAGFAVFARKEIVLRVLGVIAVLLTGWVTIKITDNEHVSLHGMPKILAAAGVLVSVVLLAPKIGTRERSWALAVFMGLMLVCPGAWAIKTVGHKGSGSFPAGGPKAAGAGDPFGGGGGPAAALGGPDPTAAVRYAHAHGGGTLVVGGQTGAQGPIIASGADIAGTSGFIGDSPVSLDWFADAVADKRIRWAFSGGGFPGFGPRDATVDALGAAAQVCAKPPGAPEGLVDCVGKADALRNLKR